MAKHPRHDRDHDDEVLNKEDADKDRAYAADAPVAGDDRSLLPRDDPYTPMTASDPAYAAPPAAGVRTAEQTAAEELDRLYTVCKPQAVEAYLQYFLARTPPDQQDAMKAKIGADLETPPGAPAPDPTVAPVANGQSITVVAADGSTVVPGSPGAARVAEGVLADVQLTV